MPARAGRRRRCCARRPRAAWRCASSPARSSRPTGSTSGVEVLDDARRASERENGSLLGADHRALQPRVAAVPPRVASTTRSPRSARRSTTRPRRGSPTSRPHALCSAWRCSNRTSPTQAAAAVDVEPRPDVDRARSCGRSCGAAGADRARAGPHRGRARADRRARATSSELTGARNPALLDRGQVEILALLQAGDRRPGARRSPRRISSARAPWGAPRTLGAALRGLGAHHDRRRTRHGDRAAERVARWCSSDRRGARADAHADRAGRRAAARRPAPRRARAARAGARHGRPARPASRWHGGPRGAEGRRARGRGAPRCRASRSLTPAEHRTATLAAEGKTNRAIAEELFVTVKAVEKHLRAVYAKLEIGSRRSSPRMLARPARLGRS